MGIGREDINSGFNITGSSEGHVQLSCYEQRWAVPDGPGSDSDPESTLALVLYFSYSVSIHFKSQAWILKVSRYWISAFTKYRLSVKFNGFALPSFRAHVMMNRDEKHSSSE